MAPLQLQLGNQNVMGITQRDLSLVLQLPRAGHVPDHARIIELGAQQLSHELWHSRDVIRDIGVHFGAKGQPPVWEPAGEPAFDGIAIRLNPNAPYARDMWRWLGFRYAAIDIDGSPGSIPLDLNFDEVPEAELGKYDLVTNYGTTEHVANQVNAFKIAHDLTAPGGVMVHAVPSQGSFNHGLVNYSPKFFWMLSRSNDYQWLHFDYATSGNSYPVPTNLIEAVVPFAPDIIERMRNTTVMNAGLLVALKKRDNRPYVPPIDVPMGVRTSDRKLLERYPTVFSPAD